MIPASPPFLRIPEPKFRPGDIADFSHLRMPQTVIDAGLVARP
jgi:2-oxoisovalerate dehydrogenase E1 alpha subunit N terminal